MAEVDSIKPEDFGKEGPLVLPQISREELLKLCAVDNEFYSTTFFPKTFRQKSPVWGREFWEPLDDSSARLVQVIAARGFAKTTRLRVFGSKRIAFGTSRTILCIGASERDAIRSVQWFRGQVERNTEWAKTFGLKPGKKWEETQIEIEHTTFGHNIWILAAGITGSLRGINFDDYRPDLILIDDPQTDEMAESQEQREKVVDLILGAVKNSLAPVVDDPNAKIVMAITPQHPDDVSQQTLKDPQWISRVFPCWTRDTVGLDVSKQISAWPERFPTTDLRADKLAFIARHKLSIFCKEMECRLIGKESSLFRAPWLHIREFPNSAPKGTQAVLAIDPVPPPSPRQMAKGLENKDFEAHYVWGRVNGEYHLLDRDRSRGHEPSWTIATGFRLAMQWRVGAIVIDAVAYQRTLKWLLEQEMRRRGIWFTVIPIADGMSKFARINSVISGLATNGRLWVGPEHTEFIEQFEAYGPTYGGIDDDIDASALALQRLSNPYLDARDEFGTVIEHDVEELPNIGGSCP